MNNNNNLPQVCIEKDTLSTQKTEIAILKNEILRLTEEVKDIKKSMQNYNVLCITSLIAIICGLIALVAT